jgi:spore coat protein U-like protein
MKKFLLLTAIASAAAVAAVAPAMAVPNASPVTGTFSVGSVTTKSCNPPVASNISSGEYDGTAAVAGATNIVFKCTNTTNATVTLLSTNTPGNATGKLKDGANNIDYTFTGDNTPKTGLGLVLGAATDLTVPVTTNIPAGQNPPPGTYTDVINITVSY